MKYITKFTEIEKDKTVNMPELFVGINSDRELIFIDINDTGNYFSISGDSVMAVKEDTAEEQTQERIIDFYEQEPPGELSYVLTDNADERLAEMIKEHYTYYAEDIKSESHDEYTNRLAEEMLDAGVISEEEAKDKEYDLDNDIDDFAEKLTDDAGDPYQYFVDSFGQEDANSTVINNGLLDLDKVAEQEDWRAWFDNSTLTDEVDYKGDTYLFEALGGGQNRDQLDNLIVSFVPEKILEQIKSNWDKYHLKVIPKKDYFPAIEQDKDEILEWYLEHGTMDSRSPLPEYKKGGTTRRTRVLEYPYTSHLAVRDAVKDLKEFKDYKYGGGKPGYATIEIDAKYLDRIYSNLSQYGGKAEMIDERIYAKGGKTSFVKKWEKDHDKVIDRLVDEDKNTHSKHKSWKIRNYASEITNSKWTPQKMEEDLSIKFAKGGTIDGKIKEWYTKNYPTDDLGEEMNDTNTFEDLWNALNKGDNVYAVIGEPDSVLRERLFEHLAKLKGVKYQFIYHKWLSEGMLTDDELFEKVANKRMSYKDASKKHKKDGGGPKKVKIADYYIDDEVGQRAKATPTAIILSKPSDDEELVKVTYTNGFIDYVPQDVIEVLPFAKGGSVGEVKVNITGNGMPIKEYQEQSVEELMGEKSLSLSKTKKEIFLISDEAIDYSEEIENAKDIDELVEVLYENNLITRDNTYNQSWWGGVYEYAYLHNWDNKFDFDYPTVMFLSKHIGNDVRAGYTKFEAFELPNYAYEEIPFLSHYQTIYITAPNGSVLYADTEDMEGYSLTIVEDDIGDMEEGDTTNLEALGELYGFEAWKYYAKGGKIETGVFGPDYGMMGEVKHKDYNSGYKVVIWVDNLDENETKDRIIATEETWSDAMEILNKNYKDLKEGEDIAIMLSDYRDHFRDDDWGDDEIRYSRLGPRNIK